MFFLFFAVDPPKIPANGKAAKNKKAIILKMIKPLRSLRLCGEYIAGVENPATYSTAQLENFHPPLFQL
jgi:hypothetical protein